VRGALPVRGSSGMRDEGGKVAPDIGRAGSKTGGEPKDPPRAPLTRHIVLVLVVLLVLERFVVAIGAGIVSKCSSGLHPAPRGWRCFRGGARATHNPGLQPWAVLCSCFRLRPISPFSYVGQVAAKSDNRGTKPFYPGSSGTNCQDFGELSRVATII